MECNLKANYLNENIIIIELKCFPKYTGRGIARALIGEWRGGGGGENSYIRVLPDEFILKSVDFKFISREISWAEHE